MTYCDDWWEYFLDNLWARFVLCIWCFSGVDGGRRKNAFLNEFRRVLELANQSQRHAVAPRVIGRTPRSRRKTSSRLPPVSTQKTAARSKINFRDYPFPSRHQDSTSKGPTQVETGHARTFLRARILQPISERRDSRVNSSVRISPSLI